MSPLSLFCNAFTLLLLFKLPNLSVSDDSNFPQLSFRMEGDKKTFRAGELAVIIIDGLKDFKSIEDRKSFNPNVSVNGVMGSSSFITGLWFGKSSQKIFFIPIMVGKFDVVISETRFNVLDSTISYHVTPGPIYEPGGIVSWMDQDHDHVVESKATVLILPKDAFGNDVTVASEGQNVYNFEVSATNANGSIVNLLDVKNKGWNQYGYVCIEFVTVTAGHISVHIKHKGVSLIGSPLPLTAHPGEVVVANCEPHWHPETKYFKLFTIMETFISQKDKFGNLVPGLFEFDVELVEKGSRLSLPIGDLQFKEVSPGIQSISFKTFKPGEFILIISDKSKKMIMNMPFEFFIFVGYCEDKQSVVNGTGLEDSKSGEFSYFRIVLNDQFGAPCPVEFEVLQVEITVPKLNVRVEAKIMPNDSINGTEPPGMLSHDASSPTRMTYLPSVFSYESNLEEKTNDFDVTYEGRACGLYEIRVFYGNVPLNGGEPFTKLVTAGEVYQPNSRLIKYDTTVSAGITNYVTVQLVDRLNNPVVSIDKVLGLSSTRSPDSHLRPAKFTNNYDGTYLGSYIAFRPAEFSVSVAYDDKHIKGSPFELKVLDSNEFPNARNDDVDVWEDQSIAVNVMENDIIRRGAPTLSIHQLPSHGSVVQYGTLFRYTPYKGFYGSDKFLYTLSANGHPSTAEVNIRVLTNPSQFVSFPQQLHAVEDTLSPQFGGFPGFEMKYSDALENISLMLTAQKGTVSLSPLLMQLWNPMWEEFSISKGEGTDACLNITGRLEVINFALKSIQYMGNANFTGHDKLMITSINKNGERRLDVPIYVQPVNDPPYIIAPDFIILEEENKSKGLFIFDTQQDKFNFSVGDPDHLFFPGLESQFQVLFSVEVSSGTLSANLPATLITTMEVKLEKSKQWQPLQAYVVISKHVALDRVTGIRFQGTIDECNSFLPRLVYYGDKHDAVLKLRVNDMGWYGCYPYCSEMRSAPLVSEATINLIRRTPMNTVVAHSLGSLIVIESILLFSFAVVLMFFMCKCVIVLSHDKKRRHAEFQDLRLNELSSTDSPENKIQLTGQQPPNLPKPGEGTSAAEVETMIH